ncbi:transcriptional activator DEMETER-like isoform X2 [Aristolochia californica]|uniref:transcriptional activator DEMETER-like isoform X2 n=1 Tax=Aristolochia californica TaxID=171875 RepID=UPI0035D5F388
MELRGGGILPSEGKNNQAPGVWIPVTPSKPEQPSRRIYRLQSDSTSGGGLCSSSTTDNSVAYFGARGVTNQVQNLNNWGVCNLTVNTSFPGLNVSPCVNNGGAGNLSTNHELSGLSVSSHLNHSGAGNWPPRTQLSTLSVISPHDNYRRSNLPSQTHQLDLNINTQAQVTKNPTAECSKIPWNQLVQMAVEGRRNGSVSSFPILGDQVVGTQSNMANPLLINHSSSHASHIWSNNGNYTQQLPIASSQQTFRSHQTSPKPNLGALENGTNSFQLMPGAPDSASWRSRNCQSVECTNLFLAGKLNPTNSSDKRNEDCLANKTGQTNQSYLLIDLSSEKDRLHAVELPSSATESTVLKETLASQPNDCFRDFSQPVEQSPSSLQSTTTLNEARNIQQDQGFDLNQTPPQKAKRKKHRPKVVTEGKRKRNLTSLTPTKVKTPKQAKTPRPITPKQATREKRKYVRKTKGILVEDVRMFEKEHLMTNLDVRPDTAEQATPPADGRIGVESLPLRGWPKSSCRRVLNFDLEAEGDTIRSSSRRTPSFDLEDQTGKNRGGAGPINVGVQSQSQNSNSQPLGLQCTINLNFPTETQNSQSQPPCSHSQREDDEKDSGSLYSEPSRSNLLFGKWQEVTEVIEVIGENPSRYVTGNSFAQVDGYTSQPQTHKPLAPLPRTKVPKENMKALARNKNQKNVPPFVHMDQTDYTLLHTPDSSRNNLVDSLLPGLRSGLQSVARTEINLNLPVGSADVDIISNGSKRGYIETITSPDPHCVNSNSATYHELIREDNAQFPDSCKKQRAEVMHSEALSITPSKVKVVNHCGSFRLEVSNERRRQQTQSNFLEENYVPDSNDSNFLCEGYLQSMPLDFKFSAHNASRRELSSMLTHEEIQLLDRLPDMSGIEGSNPVEKNMKENNKALDLICNLCSMAAVTEDRQFPPPCEHEVNIGDQANLNCANLKTKKSESEIGKHKKKRPANVVELVSSSSTNNLAPKGHKARSDYTQTFPEDRGNLWNKCDTAMKHSNRCNTVPIHFVNNLQNTSSTLSPVVASPKGPIGEVVQRLKCFNIDGGGEKFMPEPHTALVPYTLGGHIVPYDGDPAKKRRKPRPKVYLDAETNRVWKLLMWKEGSENTGPEKAKQWEEERQVFVGRANSFIARMHLVQGDRRFSPWKGSVVDSVIGVFLTQNVSDHLSSSAFMALAAKFPFHSQASSHHSSEGIRKPPEESKLSLLGVDKWQGEVLNHAACNQSFTTVNEAGTAEEKEVASSIGPFGSNIWHGTADGANGKQVLVRDNGPPLHAELSQDRTDIPRLLEDIVSSQNSVSPQNSTNSGPQIIDQIGSIFDYNSEVVNSMTLFQDKVFNGSSTFMELLQLEGPQIIQELYCYEDGFESSNATTGMESEKRRLEFNGGLDSPCPSIYQMNVPQTQRKREFTLPTNSVVASEEVDHVEISTYESTSSLTSAISETSRAQGKEKASWLAMENMADSMVPPLSCSQNASVGDSPFVKEPVHSMLVSDHRSLSDTLQSKRNSGVLQVQSNSSCCNNLGEKSDVRDQSDLGDNNKPDKLKQAESNTKDARCGYEQGFKEATGETIRKEKKRVETRKAFDWDSLRRQVCSNGAKKQRRPETLDSLDYEALRSADVHEISNAIKERGMNNMLAERIKDFLNRLLREHGSVDLEWLRDVPPDKAKDYLLSIRGLGLKSVECVRLLTLHHVAFPVDTNVGRICVRLGWVPLQPLPESLQLHLLEMYPVLESIQKYLWPRLCKLDQRTLYELHYQMITFGKVFCTKSKPNCNACPMRAECKHFASAFASARLALPGPEEKGLVTSAVPLCTDRGHKVVINPIPLPQLKMAPYPQVDARVTRCEPIIEEPASPEAQGLDGSEIAIEDAFWEDESDEIPVIKLNFEEFSQNVQNYMHENMSLQEGDMSKALVALTPEAASIPVPKLKNVSRLRTEHQVYELPDSHELLKGLDLREPDDPCPYLLAIWTPGETAESVLPPEMFCNFRESGDLCDKKTCFACNSIREAHTQIVRGTLLMPCRTAMRGSFPLNGTYFQVNEVFADHDSSLQPIDVPRALLWNLPRRTVYFGSSVTTIFRGLTTEEIQLCFWRGFVCVRGFDREKRVPRPLMARLHLLASKLVKEPKGPKSVTGRAGEPLETDKK